MVLHTLNAPAASAALQQCCEIAGPEDTIVLLGEGVFSIAANAKALQLLQQTGAAVYGLADDMRAAGQTASNGIKSIDMDGLVALTERYERQQAWY